MDGKGGEEWTKRIYQSGLNVAGVTGRPYVKWEEGVGMLKQEGE